MMSSSPYWMVLIKSSRDRNSSGSSMSSMERMVCILTSSEYLSLVMMSRNSESPCGSFRPMDCTATWVSCIISSSRNSPLRMACATDWIACSLPTCSR